MGAMINGVARVTYALSVGAQNLPTVTDSLDYYFGNPSSSPTASGSGYRSVPAPKAGTIKAAHIWTYAATTGTNEDISMYVQIVGGAAYLIETLGAATAVRVFNSNSLEIPVAQGDLIEIKMVCPAWATNPVNMIFSGTLVIE